MRPLLKKFERSLGRLLGLFGGLVCAFAAGLVAFYCYRVFQLQFLLFVAACAASILLFSMLGLLLHRYFARFFVPMFNFFGNADGQTHSDDGYSWKTWMAGTGLLLALIALIVGSLFQVHVAAIVGLVLFCAYAILPRAVVGDDRNLK